MLRFAPDVLFMIFGFGTNDAVKGQKHLQVFEDEIQEAVKMALTGGVKLVVPQTSVPMASVNPEDFIDLSE